MGSDSTGGASHGSEYPPVIFLHGIADYVARFVSRNVVLDDLPGLSYLFKTYAIERVSPYISFAKTCRGRERGIALVSDIKALVDFERDFQGAVFGAIGVIEVQAKCQFGSAMIARYGEYCLYDPRNFMRTRFHAATIARLESGVLGRSGTDRRRGAHDVVSECIPFSVAIDRATFGVFSRLVGNTADAKVLEETASTFNQDLHRFVSWIKLLSAVRNSVAHFDAYCVKKQIPVVPRSVRDSGEDATRPLYVLLVISELLSGRRKFLGKCADDSHIVFQRRIKKAVAALHALKPCLAIALGIPQAFQAQSTGYAACEKPGYSGFRSCSYVCYQFVYLAA